MSIGAIIGGSAAAMHVVKEKVWPSADGSSGSAGSAAGKPQGTVPLPALAPVFGSSAGAGAGAKS
jgi:hypothetical protein